MSKKAKKLTNTQLDAMLDLYAPPEMFDDLQNRIMAQTMNVAPKTGKAFIWYKPRYAMVALFVAILGFVVLSMQAMPQLGPNEAPEYINVATNEITEVDSFLEETVDQDILMLEYAVAEARVTEDNAPDDAEIEDFLDDLLGFESRTL